MSATLYSTGCPQCRILKQKLDEAGVQYEVNENVEEMLAMGIRSVPVLLVDGKLLNFSDSIKWVRGQE